jgi:hypothetical protein
MNRILVGPTLCLTLAMVLGGGTHSFGGVSVNPFAGIVDGNPFRLKPEPPPAPEPTAPIAPPAPLATVEVTGITDILNSRRALLEIVPGPGKPMLKPILGEGERVESVEVVSINVARGEVMVRNGTVLTNLALKVAKAPAATPPTEKVLGGQTQPLAPSNAGIGVSARHEVALGGGVAAPGNRRTIPSLPNINRSILPPPLPPSPGGQ